MKAIISFKEVATQDGRLFSSAWGSNAMKRYSETVNSGHHLVAFDIYANGTTLSKSGAYSATMYVCALLMFLGVAKKWHEVSIAPILKENIAMSRNEMAFERSVLFQRFFYASRRRCDSL